MIEINITVRTDSENQLQDLLHHIMKEITDRDYRSSEINNNRKVDMNWVYMDEGTYNWSRKDHS